MTTRAGSAGEPNKLTLIPGPGDLCCVTVSGFGGKFIGFAQFLAGYWRKPIRRFTWWRHVFICLGWIGSSEAHASGLDEHGWRGPGVYCAEAMPGGARLRRLGGTPSEAVAMYGPGALWSTGIVDLSPVQRHQIVAEALSRLGTPYSFADYLSLVFYHLGIHVPPLVRYIKATGHMMCSQYAAWDWLQGGVNIMPDRFDGDIMPADVALWLTQIALGGAS
jgi:hypothetical protein